uniref:CMP/dCMP-type deaminase domain-containing protein n=1 Tax=Lotharella oceanica TaxID=641309 RepID=A0A7S2TS26_9EUKA
MRRVARGKLHPTVYLNRTGASPQTTTSNRHRPFCSKRTILKGYADIQRRAMATAAGPSAEQLATLTGGTTVTFIDRLLSVVEEEIVPLSQEGVRKGNKLFGGAVLRKSDLSTVSASTNTETGNPLFHGEITAICDFYDMPRDERPPAKDTIFLTTHEPCPLCLSAIAWGDWDNFFYLFTYEDTKDAFSIPHDLRMHEEIFRVKNGEYNHENHYWNAWGIKALIRGLGDGEHHASRLKFEERLEKLHVTYDEMSDVYQQSKGKGAEIPLS